MSGDPAFQHSRCIHLLSHHRPIILPPFFYLQAFQPLYQRAKEVLCCEWRDDVRGLFAAWTTCGVVVMLLCAALSYRVRPVSFLLGDWRAPHLSKANCSSCAAGWLHDSSAVGECMQQISMLRVSHSSRVLLSLCATQISLHASFLTCHAHSSPKH